MESVVGLIKIISSSRIHDGINRIEFVAGPSAQEHINSIISAIDSISKLAGIDKDKLTTGLSAKFEELRLYKERYLTAEEKLSEYIAKDLSKERSEKVVKQLDYDKVMLRRIATLFVEKNKHGIILLSNQENYVIALAGSESNKSALEFIEEHAKSSKMIFRGGGSKRMAEGKLIKL